MQKIALRCLALALAIAFNVLFITVARADTVAFTTTGGLAGYVGNPSTVGYTFTLASASSVTKLGFYDNANDGLSAAVPVTIWDSAGGVRATATMPAGTNAGELSSYVYVTLATLVVLGAGTYTLGAYVTNNNDLIRFNVTTITTASGVTYGTPLASAGNARPTTNDFGNPNSYFGPNFQFNAVPEPSAWAMLSLGAVGAGIILLRRRRVGA